MTPAETIILATYFFVLVILAVYGWHRYYLVYLYMKHKDECPVPAGTSTRCPSSRSSCRSTTRCMSSSGWSRPSAGSIIRASCSRSRCSTTPPTRRGRSPSWPSGALRRKGIDIKYIHRTDRTGYKAGALEAGMQRRARASSSPSSTPTSSRPPTSCSGRSITSPIRRSRWCRRAGATSTQDYSLLTKIQAILLDAHFVLEHGGRNRGGLLLQLQRHRRHLAPRRRSTTPAAGSTTRSPKTST